MKIKFSVYLFCSTFWFIFIWWFINILFYASHEMKVTKIKEVICLSNGRCYGNRRWELVQINVYKYISSG